MALLRTPLAPVCGGLAFALSCAFPQYALAQNTERPDEIVVTSSIVETPVRRLGTPVSVIERDELQLRGYYDLADVLRTQPGIGVTNSGGPGKNTVLRIRGEEHYRTLLMIDGVKALDVSATQSAPSFDSLLTTSDLQRVEILRGPQGFIYGADAGGVVNVLSRTGEGPPSARVGLEHGGFDTTKVDASVSGGGTAGDYFVSATDLRTDGFNSQTADVVTADLDGADNTTLHAKLGWNPAEHLRLELVARDVDADAQYDGCFSPATFALVHDCLADTQQTTYKLAARLASGMFDHAFGYSTVSMVRDNLVTNESVFATDGELGRFEYTGSWQPSDALTLVYGVDLQSEDVHDGMATMARDQNGYYVEYQGRVGANVYVSMGARYDDNEDFGAHTSGRASVAVVRDLDGGATLKYRASVGTGFRPPSLFELAFNRGPFAFPPAQGAVLTEESSRGYDVGVEYDGANGLHAEITYFDQKIDDEIFFDLSGFSGYLQSGGGSTSHGVELAVDAPLGSRWRILGNWTHNETADTTNAQRLRRPRNLGNLALVYDAGGDLRLAANYRVSRDSLDVGGVALDDYAVLDLSVAYRLNDTLELSARLQNAADEAYEEVLGYNTAGRAAYAGVKMRF